MLWRKEQPAACSRHFILDGSKNYVFLQHGVIYGLFKFRAEEFFRKGEGKGKQRLLYLRSWRRIILLKIQITSLRTSTTAD